MRIFIAAFPPLETRSLAAGVIETLRRPGDGVAWVKPENLHFTLRFMGELDEAAAERVEAAALEAAGMSPAFEAALGPPGAFPSASDARVLWLGLASRAERFVALAARLEVALSRHGFEGGRRPFEPHLTLGRVREARDHTPLSRESLGREDARARDWSATLAGAILPAEAPASRFVVRSVSVVESTLAPQGSIYRVRQEAPLALPK